MEKLKMWENVPGKCEEEPVLEFYPAENKTSDTTIVIFPGGGYGGRAHHEGHNYAMYFTANGYNAFVCEYRVRPHAFPLPLLDARRAVRYVRFYADKFGIDKNRVCVMGSSAGGHLAALVSTYTEPIDFEGLDDIDKEDFIPNGTILCYPVISFADDTVGHIGSKVNLLCDPWQLELLSPKLSPELLVNDTTPPAFIWHTSFDGGVNVINSYKYATSLRNHMIPCEMHIFPYGDHGLGLSPNNPHVAQWAPLLLNWLKLMFN